MTKRTETKQHRIYDYKYGMREVKDEKGEKKMVPYLASVEKRAERLPAKPRTPYIFEIDGLRVTVLMSDGQVINKGKAFRRFCEEKGGYGEAIRAQNMLDPKDLPPLTRVNEDNKIIV